MKLYTVLIDAMNESLSSDPEGICVSSTSLNSLNETAQGAMNNINLHIMSASKSGELKSVRTSSAKDVEDLIANSDTYSATAAYLHLDNPEAGRTNKYRYRVVLKTVTQ